MEITTIRRNAESATDLRIGLIIKAARERKRLTLIELAMALDTINPPTNKTGMTSQGTVSNWEQGRRTLTRDRAEALSKVLDLPIKALDPEAA